MFMHAPPADCPYFQSLTRDGLDCVIYSSNFDPQFGTFLSETLGPEFGVTSEQFDRMQYETHVLCIRCLASRKILSFCALEREPFLEGDVQFTFLTSQLAGPDELLNHPERSLFKLVHLYVRHMLMCNHELWPSVLRSIGRYQIVLGLSRANRRSIPGLDRTLGRLCFLTYDFKQDRTYGFNLDTIVLSILTHYLPVEEGREYDSDGYPLPHSPSATPMPSPRASPPRDPRLGMARLALNE